MCSFTIMKLNVGFSRVLKKGEDVNNSRSSDQVHVLTIHLSMLGHRFISGWTQTYEASACWAVSDSTWGFKLRPVADSGLVWVRNPPHSKTIIDFGVWERGTDQQQQPCVEHQLWFPPLPTFWPLLLLLLVGRVPPVFTPPAASGWLYFSLISPV